MGEKLQVIALTAEATLQRKHLDEITDAEELAAAFKQLCEVDAPSASFRLRKGLAGTAFVERLLMEGITDARSIQR